MMLLKGPVASRTDVGHGAVPSTSSTSLVTSGRHLWLKSALLLLALTENELVVVLVHLGDIMAEKLGIVESLLLLLLLLLWSS